MRDVVASLVYDSWTDLVPDLRAFGLPDRHLIFEGNGLILDLLLKTQGHSRFLHVGGQVLPQHQPLGMVSDVAVVIEQGSGRSSTRTNALGEFAFQVVPTSNFDLVIILKEHRLIVRGLSNDEPRTWQVFAGSLAEG